MVRLVDYIEDNILMIKMLVKIGMMPLSILTDYHVYTCFMVNENIPEKMKRYSVVATQLKISVTTVRRIVKNMESKINPTN